MDDDEYYFEISIEIDGWPWNVSDMIAAHLALSDEEEEVLTLDRKAA
jgi:hypothetical protein